MTTETPTECHIPLYPIYFIHYASEHIKFIVNSIQQIKRCEIQDNDMLVSTYSQLENMYPKSMHKQSKNFQNKEVDKTFMLYHSLATQNVDIKMMIVCTDFLCKIIT